MRSIKRRTILAPILLSTGLLALGIVGTVGTLWALGKIDLPFLSARPARFRPPEGAKAVFLRLKPVPAYTRITREHLFQPSGEPKLLYLTPKEIQERGFIMDYNEIINRVAARDLSAGNAFREEEFLPKGTRVGIAGGTPPGKRSLTVDAAKIAGINSLRAGDHFDLVATYLNDIPRDAGKTHPAHVRIDHLPGQKKYVMSRVLVQKGIVIQPVTTQLVPKANTAVPTGGKAPQVTVQEAVLAVAPEEVAQVTQALNGATELRVVQRSGHPDEAYSETHTPDTQQPPPNIVIETIHGGKREFLSFPHHEPAPRPTQSSFIVQNTGSTP